MYLRKGMFGHDVFDPRSGEGVVFGVECSIDEYAILTNTSGWVRREQVTDPQTDHLGLGRLIGVNRLHGQPDAPDLQDAFHFRQRNPRFSRTDTWVREWVDTRPMPAPTKPETFSYSAVVHPAWTSNQASPQ